MKPVNFNGSNKTFTAPKDWDEEKYGKCGDLHVFQGQADDGRNVVVSCWQPSEEEAHRLRNGMPIFLEITSTVQPPVALSVGDTEEKIHRLCGKRLRVVHFPQVGSLTEAFKKEVKDEYEASLLLNTLADQHLWLERNNVIPDYSNAIMVEMWDEDMDADENGEKWCDYWNEEMLMEWDEFEETYILNDGQG